MFLFGIAGGTAGKSPAAAAENRIFGKRVEQVPQTAPGKRERKTGTENGNGKRERKNGKRKRKTETKNGNEKKKKRRNGRGMRI